MSIWVNNFTNKQAIIMPKKGNDRSNIHLGVTLIGVILCYTPYYDRNFVSQLELPGPLNAIHNGIFFKCASAVALMLASLLFIDLLFDFVASMISQVKQQQRVKEKKKKDNHVDVMNNKEMLFFIAGIIIVPINAFFSTGAVKDVVMITQISTRAQVMFFVGVILASLNRFDNKYFPTWITLSTFIPHIIGQTIYPYYVNNIFANPALSLQLYWAVFASSWMVGAIIFALCAYYIIDTILFTFCGFQRWKLSFYDSCCRRVAPFFEIDGSSKSGKSKRSDTEMQPYTNGHIFFRMTYCLLVLVYIVVRIVIQVKLPFPFSVFPDDNTLFLIVIPSILLAFFVVLFNLRLVKHEAVESLISLLDAKKSYVRYISHGTYPFL